MKKFDICSSQVGKAELTNWHDRFKEMVNFPTESQTVSTRFGENHVLVAGPEDAPPVIAFHAMRTGSSFLLNEMGALLKNYCVYAPDLPGQSIKGLPIQLSLKNNEHALWASDVMNSLKLDHSFVLGVSWGGFVARDLAVSFPQRVSKLALLVPAGIANGSHLTGLAKMAWPMIRYKFSKTKENLKKLLSPIMTSEDSEWEGFMECAIDHMKVDMRIPPLASNEDLKNLKMPILAITGEQDISFPGEKIKTRLASLCPNSEVEVLKRCKHCPPTNEEFRNWFSHRLSGFFDK